MMQTLHQLRLVKRHISGRSNIDLSTISNSYTMAMRDLPDIYARALGPAALGLGHIYQANPEWPWYK